ncbi:winged-helix domain-containing protein [Haloarcula sp. NS06]|uniref:winged-helix domain-containing protein n=1 Tax=Haloarcula sp. NS06 TaxID=3409688 RepID=UPI003DA706DF
MRPRIEWMTQADERILEFLQEKDIVASPSVIAANIDYTGEYISRRCRKLEDAGLLQRVDASNYRLTNLGYRFLTGEVDATEITQSGGSENV